MSNSAPDDGATIVPIHAVPTRDECPGAYLDGPTYDVTDPETGIVETRQTRTFPLHYWQWMHTPTPFAGQVCATCGARK